MEIYCIKIGKVGDLYTQYILDLGPESKYYYTFRTGHGFSLKNSENNYWEIRKNKGDKFIKSKIKFSELSPQHKLNLFYLIFNENKIRDNE